MYPRINGQVSSITLQSIIGYFFQALGTGREPRGKGRGEKTAQRPNWKPNHATKSNWMPPNVT